MRLLFALFKCCTMPFISVGLCWTLLDMSFLSVGLLDSKIPHVGRGFSVCPTKSKIKKAYKSVI